MLTMSAYATTGQGPALTLNREDVAYEVHGLPDGEQAWIAEIHQTWQVLRAIDGVQGQWTGNYTSADEALNSLT